MLKNANGKIRIIVPSRLAFGRNGTKLIPSNASLDYVIHAIDTDSLPAYEDVSIRKYMVANGLQPDDFVKTSTGIYYKINELGNGDYLTSTSTFKSNYDLKFLDGASFQKADSVTFKLSDVIAAWQEVMPNVKENGKVRMFIPSSQAYGVEGNFNPNTGTYSIPPFSSLDYDVKVLNIVK
jgi:FKBP-type peptidyl-prolyl cis-trans isomerase